MKKKENNVKNKKVESTLIKDVNADTGEVKKFIFILIGVALVAVLLYFVSSKLLIKDGVEKDDTPTQEVTFNYNKVDVGNVFNRPYKEYYVYAYDTESLKASYYSSLMSLVDSKTHKVYLLDLSEELNKKYVGEKSNKNAKNASELSLVEPTLIKIVDGKVSKYLDNLEDIEKELKSLKSSK